MNITVNTQQLAQRLRVVEKVTPQKPAVPIYGHVLIEAHDGMARLSTTDTELSLTTAVPATVNDAGTVTLPGKRLLDIVNQITDTETHLILDGNKVRIASGNFKSRLQALHAEDFPTLAEPEPGGVLLSGSAFRGMIKKTRECISDADKRYFMNGALFVLSDAVMAMVTTDGKRLSIATAPHTGGDSRTIIPTKTLDMLLVDTAEEISFSKNSRQMFFSTEGSVLSSRMVDGNFPNYQRIIPTANDRVLTIPREAFLSALRRVSLASGDNRSMSLAIEEGMLSLRSAAADIGEAIENVAAAYDGPAMKTAIDWSYMETFLNAATGSTITLALADPVTGYSGALFSDGADFISVIMLMKA